MIFSFFTKTLSYRNLPEFIYCYRLSKLSISHPVVKVVEVFSSLVGVINFCMYHELPNATTRAFHLIQGVENALKTKTKVFWLPSVAQKRLCLISLVFSARVLDVRRGLTLRHELCAQ